jgi:hypothetical protein
MSDSRAFFLDLKIYLGLQSGCSDLAKNGYELIERCTMKLVQIDKIFGGTPQHITWGDFTAGE